MVDYRESPGGHSASELSRRLPTALPVHDVGMSALVPVGDHLELRRALACFPSGVAVVCADLAEGPVGMLVSTFTPVSLDPPLASICVMSGSRTWSRLVSAPRLGISFLGHDHQELCARFSARVPDPFEALELTRSPEGAVFVPGATAWLDCAPHDAMTAGDHSIVLLRITALSTHHGASPLIFHGSRYHRLSA